MLYSYLKCTFKCQSVSYMRDKVWRNTWCRDPAAIRCQHCSSVRTLWDSHSHLEQKYFTGITFSSFGLLGYNFGPRGPLVSILTQRIHKQSNPAITQQLTGRCRGIRDLGVGARMCDPLEINYNYGFCFRDLNFCKVLKCKNICLVSASWCSCIAVSWKVVINFQLKSNSMNTPQDKMHKFTWFYNIYSE